MSDILAASIIASVASRLLSDEWRTKPLSTEELSTAVGELKFDEAQSRIICNIFDTNDKTLTRSIAVASVSADTLELNDKETPSVWFDKAYESIQGAPPSTDTQEIGHELVATLIAIKELPQFYSTQTSGEEMTSTPSTPTSPSTITIDTAVAVGVNAMLSSATKGEITDINEYIKEHASTKELLSKTKKELSEAVAKARLTPAASTGASTTALGELTYEIVEKDVTSLFSTIDPRAGTKRELKNLPKFPTLVWKDASGAVVDHPNTPKIDSDYLFDPINTMQFLTGLLFGMNQWLFGHTGSGKTTFAEQVCSRIGWPVTRINLDSNLERADLVGQVQLVNTTGATTTHFEEGILPKAMQSPGVFLIDEIDAGRPDILFVIQRALESKGLMLTEDKGRIVQPHPLFRFVATANTRGQGDEFGMYSGTRVMNASMIDRFQSFLTFDYMSAQQEAKLIASKVPGLDTDRVEQICRFAGDIRAAFKAGEISTTMSPRGLIVLAEVLNHYLSISVPAKQALDMALGMTCLNKSTNDTVIKVKELAARSLTEKPSARKAA